MAGVTKTSLPRAETVLPGGGEVGTLMGLLDWSSPALGPLQSWPRCLRTAVPVLLSSRFSMWIRFADAVASAYHDPAMAPIAATVEQRCRPGLDHLTGVIAEVIRAGRTASERGSGTRCANRS